MTLAELLEPFIKQGILGVLCGVMLWILVKLFQKVLSVVEKNTEGFYKNSSALNSLESTIRESIKMNGEKNVNQ